MKINEINLRWYKEIKTELKTLKFVVAEKNINVEVELNDILEGIYRAYKNISELNFYSAWGCLDGALLLLEQMLEGKGSYAFKSLTKQQFTNLSKLVKEGRVFQQGLHDICEFGKI